MEQVNTITLDGVQHNVSDFSQIIQNAVNVYNRINEDLGKAQIEVMKSQAALQTIGAQIAEAVKKELEVKAATAAVETKPESTGEASVDQA